MFKKFTDTLFKNPKRKEIDDLFQEGIACKNKGEYLKSQKLLEEALSKDPESEIIKLKLWQVKEARNNSNETLDQSITNNSPPSQ